MLSIVVFFQHADCIQSVTILGNSTKTLLAIKEKQENGVPLLEPITSSLK